MFPVEALGASNGDAPLWNLEDTKARFSERVRLADSGVPQHVSVRGRSAIVVLGAAEYARLAPAANATLANLFSQSPFGRLNDFDDALGHERVPVREVPDFKP